MLSRFVHPPNTALPKLVLVLGILILVRFVQPPNAESPILLKSPKIVVIFP